MHLQVMDANDNVLWETDQDLDENQEARATLSSSTGSAIHTFYRDTPVMILRVPFASEEAPEENPPATEEDQEEVVVEETEEEKSGFSI